MQIIVDVGLFKAGERNVWGHRSWVNGLKPSPTSKISLSSVNRVMSAFLWLLFFIESISFFFMFCIPMIFVFWESASCF